MPNMPHNIIPNMPHNIMPNIQVSMDDDSNRKCMKTKKTGKPEKSSVLQKQSTQSNNPVNTEQQEQLKIYSVDKEFA